MKLTEVEKQKIQEIGEKFYADKCVDTLGEYIERFYIPLYTNYQSMHFSIYSKLAQSNEDDFIKSLTDMIQRMVLTKTRGRDLVESLIGNNEDREISMVSALRLVLSRLFCNDIGKIEDEVRSLGKIKESKLNYEGEMVKDNKDCIDLFNKYFSKGLDEVSNIWYNMIYTHELNYLEDRLDFDHRPYMGNVYMNYSKACGTMFKYLLFKNNKYCKEDEEMIIKATRYQLVGKHRINMRNMAVHACEQVNSIAEHPAFVPFKTSF